MSDSSESGSDRIDYQRIREQIARSVRHVCPTWLSSHFDDIVQAASMRVLHLERKGELPDPLPASYLWKVAYSATVDRIRRIRRERSVALDEVVLEDLGEDRRSDPHADQSMRELATQVDRCLQRLIEPRRLVVGFHLLGHDLGEIETISRWGPKRVRNLLYRGLADLRRCLTMKGM